MGTVWPCNSEFVCSSWVAIVGSLGLPRFFASEKTGPCRVCASQRKANVSCVGYGQVQSLSMCLNVPQFPLHIPRGLIDATPPPPNIRILETGLELAHNGGSCACGEYH